MSSVDEGPSDERNNVDKDEREVASKARYSVVNLVRA
jgi:hypothetical protein